MLRGKSKQADRTRVKKIALNPAEPCRGMTVVYSVLLSYWWQGFGAMSDNRRRRRRISGDVRLTSVGAEYRSPSSHESSVRLRGIKPTSTVRRDRNTTEARSTHRRVSWGGAGGLQPPRVGQNIFFRAIEQFFGQLPPIVLVTLLQTDVYISRSENLVHV